MPEVKSLLYRYLFRRLSIGNEKEQGRFDLSM